MALKITKDRLVEMIIIAFVSAGLAFLQNLLTDLVSPQTVENNPAVAGVIGAGIRAITKRA